jgi:hypothetical protein
MRRAFSTLLQNLFGSAVTAEFSRLGGYANHREAER